MWGLSRQPWGHSLGTYSPFKNPRSETGAPPTGCSNSDQGGLDKWVEARWQRLPCSASAGPALAARAPDPAPQPCPYLSAGLGQQVGCGLWVGGGSVWLW